VTTRDFGFRISDFGFRISIPTVHRFSRDDGSCLNSTVYKIHQLSVFFHPYLTVSCVENSAARDVSILMRRLKPNAAVQKFEIRNPKSEIDPFSKMLV